MDIKKCEAILGQVNHILDQSALTYSERFYIINVLDQYGQANYLEQLFTEKYGLKEVKP